VQILNPDIKIVLELLVKLRQTDQLRHVLVCVLLICLFLLVKRIGFHFGHELLDHLDVAFQLVVFLVQIYYRSLQLRDLNVV